MVRVLAVVLSLMFLALGSAYAQDNASSSAWQNAVRDRVAAMNAEEASKGPNICVICVNSCGRKWPRAGGVIRPFNNNTISKGPNCGGPFASRNTDFPVLCCLNN